MQITMGRHRGNDLVLEESPLVSRNHVLLEKTAAGWAITDVGSSNGLWVNRVQLDKNDAHLLKDQDIVEIGLESRSAASSVYRYRFFTKANVKRKVANQNGTGDAGLKDGPQLKQLYEEAVASTELLRRKMIAQWKAQEQAEQIAQKGAMERAIEDMQCKHEKLQQTLEQNQIESRVQKEEKERAMEKMRMELEAKAAEQEKLQKIVEEKQAEVQAQQKAWQSQEEEVHNLQAKLKKEQETMQVQLGTLKLKVEEGKKQQEMMKAARQKEVKEIMTRVEGVMEDELVCAICAELLVQASSLNCAHSFCSYCIQKWMLQKKECPNCRAPITSSVPSLVLDNYINKVVTCLSQDLQDHRKRMIIERKREQDQFESEREVDAVQNQVQNEVVTPEQQRRPPMQPLIRPNNLQPARAQHQNVGRAAQQNAGRAAQQNAGRAAQQNAGRAAQQNAGRAAQQNAGRAAQQNAGRAAQQNAGRVAQQNAGRAAQQNAGQMAQQNAGRAAQQNAGRAAQQNAGQMAQQNAGRAAQQNAGRAAQQNAGQMAQQNARRAAQQNAGHVVQQNAGWQAYQNVWTAFQNIGWATHQNAAPAYGWQNERYGHPHRRRDW